MRRVQQVSPRSNQAIRLISSQALGPRDRLVLVQVGEDEVLFDNAPWCNDAATRAGSHSELEIYLKRWHVFQAGAQGKLGRKKR